jgi:formylglycine-generating enzyme required for sulfatase activity
MKASIYGWVISAAVVATPQPINASPSTCRETLEKPASEDNNIRQFKTELRTLAQLRIALDLSQLHPDSLTLSALRSEYRLKENLLFSIAQNQQGMNHEDFVSLLVSEIQLLQKNSSPSLIHQRELRRESERTHQEQQKTLRSLVIDGTVGVFHPIAAGSFIMGDRWKKKPVTLSKPFNLMATPVTQLIWRRVAELANQRLQLKKSLPEDPSQQKGDLNPIESVTFRQVKAWIQALNKLSEEGAPELEEIFVNHNKGAKYRLPSEAEWEYVAKRRGDQTEDFFINDGDNLLTDFAWIHSNAKSQTQPVATKKPLLVDNLPFYDFIGNVWEFTKDNYLADLPGGLNPTGPAKLNPMIGVVIRGGAANTRDSELSTNTRMNSEVDVASPNQGFRLVREP